jgi:hypothetical protein
MDVDFSNFEREDFRIDGFYRALVEDNVDPLEAGRVRVRILGIHSMNVLEAPTENLPWAEPVLPLEHSGGANLQNIDMRPGVAATPNTKYTPMPIIPPLVPQLPTPVPTDSVNAATTEFATIPEHRDTNLCNSGTGGKFVTPAKGSIVWIFFDGGCHLRPQYFAMATQRRDWQAQKLKLIGTLKDRDSLLASINALISSIESTDNPEEHKITHSAVSQSSVKTPVPKVSSTPISTQYLTSIRMENLSSWTSPGGTTILSDHTFGKERLFIIHKGFSQFVDENGQVVKIVGKTSPAPINQTTSLNPIHTSGLANDETEYIAGLKNLYIIGDYNVVTKGNCFFECHGSTQINAAHNVGIVARNGNVNVLAEKGSLNIEALQSLNLKSKDIQIEADNNIIIKSKKSIDINAFENIQASSKKEIKLDSLAINQKSQTHKTETNTFEVASTTSVNLNSQGSLVLDSASFSANANANMLLTASAMELKAASTLNCESAIVNIKGTAKVSVSADGEVSLLGANTNIFGTAMASVGGAIATLGGGQTTLTGIVTLGIGAVTPPSPALPVASQYAPVPIVPQEPYTELPFIPSKPDLPIIPTPSQQTA